MALLFPLALLIYFLPTIVAGCYRHYNTGAICAFNLFRGWTVVGWVIALVWAFTRPNPVDLSRHDSFSIDDVALRRNIEARASVPRSPRLSWTPWAVLAAGGVILAALATANKQGLFENKGDRAATAIIATQTTSTAANQTSSRILALDQSKQFAVFKGYLQASNEPCDRVNRVMYQGGSQAVDTWSIGCADGHSYAVAVEPDANGSTKILTCAELKAVDAALMKRMGKPPNKDVGCWIKFKGKQSDGTRLD
jgi:Superinfection immunity protein